MPLSPETGLGPDKNPEIVFPFPAGDRESKEEPMSEFRRDDTASWDAQEVRQAQGARREAASVHRSKSRPRRRRQNPLAVLVGYLIFVLLASAILAGMGWMLGSDFCAFNRGALRETSVEVTAEDSVSTVADKLQDAGLIKYKWFFKLYAGISHADKKIGIGTYTLNTEMDYRALILGMHNSSGNLTAETVTVTIPEGYTVRQTIRLLAEKGVNTEENLLEAAKTATYDYSFISNNSEEEISAFENYVYVWNINGAAFKKPFENNPDGFSEKMRKTQTEQLEMAEKVRKNLVEPLVKFREDIKDKTGREITEKLYNLLEQLEVTNAVSQMFDKLKADGEIAQAKEQIRLWNLLMGTLDQTVAVAGDLKISLKRYFELLSLRLSALQIADIPRTVDSVSVGTATRVRLNNEKAVFLIGCIDGVFPAVPSASGLFSAYELKTLIANNLPFGDEPAELADFENYMAYKSATAPSQKLFVSFYKTDLTGGTYMQSSIINEIIAVFPNILLHREEEYCSVADSTWAILPAFEECARNFNSDSNEERALKKYFSENEIFKDKYSAVANASKAKPFVFDDKSNVGLLFGNDLNISASQVEKFSLCRFSYFCNYGLNVRERRKAEINPLEYGTFIHYIMEVFFSKYSKNEFSNMSEDEINKECDSILDDYVNKHFGGSQKNNPRLMYRFNKIRENVHFLVLHIIEELKNSGFEPVDCELKIDGDIPGYEVVLPTGQKILLRGSVDRVDILKKGEENYIRIIDYKTGSKEFKLSDILYGLNLQMLIYLYAITLGGEERYGKVTPAGILYMPATVKPISADNNISDEQINEQVSKGLKMNGMLLNSLDVIDNSDAAYISFNTKNGTLTAGGSLASLEELGMIFKKLDMTVAKMGTTLYSGNVEASPLKGGKDSCEYCPYDSICAYHMSDCRNSFSLKNDEVCRILEEEQKNGGEE